MSTLAKRLEAEVELAVQRLHAHPRARQVLDGTASAAVLARYYVTAHRAVEQAPHFLRQCHSQLRHRGAGRLVDLLASKIDEEQGHDRWLRDDLEALGCSLGSAAAPSAAPAAELYNAFHDHVSSVNAYAFLGTAWVLEALSVRCAGNAARNLQANAAIPGIGPGSSAGLSFLIRHYEEDVQHTYELARVLEDSVADVADQDYLLLCARFTATTYADFFA